MDMLFYALLALLSVTLITAAFYDLTSYTLPNWISYVVFGLFVVAALAQFSLSLTAQHLASGLIVFVVMYVQWLLRLIAGGDVKLWAATAFWFELSRLPHQLFAVILVGGVLTLLLIVVRRGLALCARKAGREDVQPHLPELLRVGGHVPYGFAISAGTLWALLTSAPGYFQSVISGWEAHSAQMVVAKLFMIFFR